MQSKKLEQFIPFDKISDYIYEVDKHYTELTSRQRKVHLEQINSLEAHKLNTLSLLKFHEVLTNLLKSFNIRIPSQEESAAANTQKIFNSVTSLSNQLKIFDEVKQSILQMSTQAQGDDDKVKELIEKFKGSSLYLHNAFLEISSQLSNLKAIEPVDPLSTNCQTIIAQEEEIKQSEVHAQKDQSDQFFESMFSFYNDLDSLKQSDWQIRKNFKYKILHPFKFYDEDTSAENMDQIEVTLSICTLWNGFPHGLAFIQYEDPENKNNSFNGVSVFDHGQLHNAPLTSLEGDGRYKGYLFTKMENGRPADGSYHTQFFKDRWKQNVDSLETTTDVSGWQKYSGQVDKERRYNGKGKYWYYDGSIYIGGWKNDYRTEGKEYKLQEDGTHTLYNIKFDEDGKEIERKEMSKRHKLV